MYQSEKKSLAGVFTFLPIDDVYYGVGAINKLEKDLAEIAVKRALLITGNTLATQTNLVDRVKRAGGGRIAGVFHETTQHVHRASVVAAIDAARAHSADAIISFGGGSANDTGKAVVLGLAEGIDKIETFDRHRVRFEYPATVEVPPVRGTAIPLIAISTTLSGGEFTHFAGITDSERQVKDLYIDKKLAAHSIYLDPELTLETPDWLWLSTGIRSVDHCVEALCSVNAHPFTDALAHRSLSMLNQFLRECKADPTDVAARTHAHLAAWMSVCGLANVNLGLSHGIGHQLGARNDVPHGVTSCVMMTPTMAFNQDHVGARQAWIAEALGIDTRGMDQATASAAARRGIGELVTDLALPTRLRDVGVAQEDFPALARDAMEDLVVATNPRPVRSIEDVIDLLHTAW